MHTDQNNRLTPYLGPAGAWAFALGTSIGWGSLVVTSNTYLSQAGPLGSTLGMIAGTLIMLVISRNYYYMICRCPSAGGAYSYAREVFGYDHGFLIAWFLMLTYLAMLWANATALPLFARYFLGHIFHVGRMYTVFGYDVYLGESLLTIAAIVLAAALLRRSKNAIAKLMVGMVAFFAAAIIVCFVAALAGGGAHYEPAYIPDKTALSQIIKIACISPWAFIGFENISHFAEEYTFQRQRIFRILVAAVITTTVLYIFVTLLSASAYPAEYNSWFAYIADHGNLDGIKGLPAFYAAYHYLGNFGVTILILALLCLILTSLIGNITALSRLFYALAKDGILPERFATLNEKQIPAKAIALIGGVSLIIPFAGRTAIGWIVDVTTIGATIIYGFVSACAFKAAREDNAAAEKATGLAGLLVMIAFGLYLLVPNLFTTGSMEPETYILFVAWAVLGFAFFRQVLRKDSAYRFGKSIIVWIALLSLVLFVSLVWMSQSTIDVTGRVMGTLQSYYDSKGLGMADDTMVADALQQIQHANARSILIVVGLFAVSLGILINNYALLNRRAEQNELELIKVREQAGKDSLTGVRSKLAYAEEEQLLDAGILAKASPAFAIAVCDVNGLKKVNDTLGHKAGDAYIRAASALICEVFEHSPVYRVGGDEFVVVLQGRDFEDRESLLGSLYLRSVANISAGKVVVSAGYSDYEPETDNNVHDVFERADAAMYQNKQQLKSIGAPTRE